MTGYVYVLKRNTIPFYVGWTKYPKRRLQEHCATRNDFSIEMSILQTLSVEANSKNWVASERYWIRCFVRLGFSLENKNPGGGGPLQHTAQTRERIRATLTGRRVSAETVKKIVASRTESNVRLNRQCWSKGKTKETDLRLKSASEKLSKPKGPFTEAHRKNLSVAHKGQTVSESRRESVRRHHTGKTVSDATRKRISEMAARRWKNWKATGHAGSLGKGSVDVQA